MVPWENTAKGAAERQAGSLEEAHEWVAREAEGSYVLVDPAFSGKEELSGIYESLLEVTFDKDTVQDFERSANSASDLAGRAIEVEKNVGEVDVFVVELPELSYGIRGDLEATKYLNNVFGMADYNGVSSYCLTGSALEEERLERINHLADTVVFLEPQEPRF